LHRFHCVEDKKDTFIKPLERYNRFRDQIITRRVRYFDRYGVRSLITSERVRYGISEFRDGFLYKLFAIGVVSITDSVIQIYICFPGNGFFGIEKTLRDLARDLSEDKLDGKNFLPRSIPRPFKGMEPDSEGYKRFLTDASAKIDLLDLLVEEGFIAVWRRIPAVSDDKSRQAIRSASRALDLKAVEVPIPPLKDVATFIRTTFDKLDHDLGTTPRVGVRPTDIQIPSFEKLTLEIRTVSVMTWLVFGGIATALGAYILIINNLGFGVPADYFTCLFWGFGLPVSGQKLVEATIGTVGSTLGISMPKTS
jgi:hypothetical protein